MRIDVNEHCNLRLREVFDSVFIETSEGNLIGVCMRDDTLEINVMPKGKNTGNFWRVDMAEGLIEPTPVVSSPSIKPGEERQEHGK